MGRPRKKDKHLPPCVHFRHGAYFLVRKGKWTRLGKDLASALGAYAREWQVPLGSFAALVDAALKARKSKLSAGSWGQYQSAARKLKHIFMDFAPDQIEPLHVKRLKREMIDRQISFNSCLSVLRLVMEYAVEEELVKVNPCIGTKPYKIAPRKRHITRQEYEAIYSEASPQLQVVMDLLYMTGQRVNDVLTIKYSDLQEDGIYFEQAKTKTRLVVAWSPELRGVVERARSLHGNLRSLSLLHTRRGQPIDYDTILDIWLRTCERAKVDDAQMRDLRAMSGTDAKRQGKNPTKLLGHASEAMTKRYLRSKEIPQVEGPSLGRENKK